MPLIFDRKLVARRLGRALGAGVAGADFLLVRAAEEIGERLQAVSRRFERALAIAPPGDALTRVLEDSGKVGQVIRADLFRRGPDGNHPADLVLDDEALPFAPESLDLVVSALTLQWANDLPGALVQIRRALRPDGLFMAILPGGDSLSDLRAAFLEAESARGGASPRVAPFADVRDLGALLQRAGFALPVADVDRLTLTYRSPFALLADLKAMGATNALAERSRQPMTRGLLAEALARHEALAATDNGRVATTLSLMSLSGWAPHESQQKPLKPGSAKARLADALKPPAD